MDDPSEKIEKIEAIASTQRPKTKDSRSSPKKSSSKVRNMSARLLAAQAVYQASLNAQSIPSAASEYLDFRQGMNVEEEEIVKPNAALFSKIMTGVAERKDDVAQIVQASMTSGSTQTEPLIKAILMCAGYELLAHDDMEPAIIINDYLNVAHAFFEKSEVGLINAVLDSVSKGVRDQ